MTTRGKSGWRDSAPDGHTGKVFPVQLRRIAPHRRLSKNDALDTAVAENLGNPGPPAQGHNFEGVQTVAQLPGTPLRAFIGFQIMAAAKIPRVRTRVQIQPGKGHAPVFALLPRAVGRQAGHQGVRLVAQLGGNGAHALAGGGRHFVGIPQRVGHCHEGDARGGGDVFENHALFTHRKKRRRRGEEWAGAANIVLSASHG